ncbi:MAG: aminoglycoside phosphotransferase [Burkholderiaceae bacterium]|nr:aminoglycoside phosphotransferase [Burkholderiaceae bacterium]
MNAMPDARLAQALRWIEDQAPRLGELGWALAPETLRPASSDASFRRYFRIDGAYQGQPDHLILMDAPPEKENIQPFVAIDKLLLAAGLHVPTIWHQDLEQGFLLCADLGNTTYAQALSGLGHAPHACANLYRDACQALIRLQTFSLAPENQTAVAALAPYDQGRLMQEMRLFDEWYLGRHRTIALGPTEREQLFAIYDLIAARCLSQPVVIVHRDYHSRNLMVTGKNNPGVLDFQDAVIGPITYDLVSLLRDAYVEWTEETQIDWAIGYWEHARQAGLPVAKDFADFWRDFEWMGLQRHLKVLGIFARLHYRDGKDNYLKDLPLVMRYAMGVARRYQGLGPLAKLLERCA